MLEIRKINEVISLGILDLKAFSQQTTAESNRELEKKGTIYVLKKMLSDETLVLEYLPTKKPILKGRTEHVSISHSHDKLAVIINKNESTGVDIELIRDKVLKIQHKFLNQSEVQLANNSIDTLITIWAAKEALYKVYGLKEVEFKSNLRVKIIDERELFCEIELSNFKKSYRLVTEKIEDYRLVYVMNEI